MRTYRVIEITSQNSQNGKKEITGDKTSNNFFSPPCFPSEESPDITFPHPVKIIRRMIQLKLK